MSKKTKKGVLGGASHIETTVESPAVDVPGKTKAGSHLAEYQWKPGESGNPAGRPKVDLKPEIRAFADEADPKTGKTRFRVWLEMADRRARQGSPKHLEMLLAYGWGRPNQALEIESGVNFTQALTSMRSKRELAEADATIAQYLATLPSVTPTNGHSDAQTAKLAAAMPDQDLSKAREDDAEQPAIAAQPAQKITVEL